MLARHYGRAGTFASGDLNDDGVVNFTDLVILASKFGGTFNADSPATSFMRSSAIASRAVGNRRRFR